MKLSRDAFKGMAEEFVAGLHPATNHATLIALRGDLGASKTTFVQDAAHYFGAPERAQSPTFVIEKRYTPTSGPFSKIVHIDAYRLDDADELRHLGFEELLTVPTNLIFLEWPERVEELLPPWTQMLKFKFVDEEHRIIDGI